MNYSPLLGPIVALVAWTLVMMIWMAVTRLPAMKKAGIDVRATVGGRGANLECKLHPLTDSRVRR